MLSPGASESDGQVALAFANIVRHQVHQQVRDAIDEFLGLWKLPDICRDFGVPSRQRAELRYEMWIGQKADVEDQVGVVGHAILEAKTDARNQNALAAGSFLKLVEDVCAQLVDIKFG